MKKPKIGAQVDGPCDSSDSDAEDLVSLLSPSFAGHSIMTSHYLIIYSERESLGKLFIV